jgi:hypothetical protein
MQQPDLIEQFEHKAGHASLLMLSLAWHWQICH